MEKQQGQFDILGDIRILDAAAWIAGTGAGAILGDLGAEVIKIEDPVAGDTYRGMATAYGDIMSVKGRHIGFETANLNKKSITLDLTKDEGREILYQLVAKSDIFHTNFLKKTREKLAITYDDLRVYNPKLIYCVTTGFGTHGPSAHRRAYDTTAQAQSGIMWEMGDRAYDEPFGVVGAFAMVCGLAGRDRLGIGQEVHVSMLGSALHIQSQNVNMALLRGRPYGRFCRKKSPNPMSNNYRCRDGKWLMLAEPVSDRYWWEFCDVLGLPILRDKVDFSTSAGRKQHCTELIEIIGKTFASKDRDEWIKIFEGKSAGFGYAPIYDLSEAISDPQAIENEYITDFNHPVLGPISIRGFPFWFSKTPARIRSEAPEHGQHTEQVLIEILNYDWEQIGMLRAKGIICREP
ncbi:CaiB/BaiF CoA transferase family protein [Chloroflexota bacterium]